MSICTESTRGLREPLLQVLVVVGDFAVRRVNLQEKYDYPTWQTKAQAGGNTCAAQAMMDGTTPQTKR